MNQIPITKYYKCMTSPSLNIMDRKTRKREGSEPLLSPTPSKRGSVIIDLVTDSEEDLPSESQETERSPQTPTKSQETSSSNSSQSGRSGYSPYKKRMFLKRSPVGRNSAKKAVLHSQFSNPDQDDEEFKNIFKDVDDKTNFLQQIINRCLNSRELTNLFDKMSQDLLSQSVQLGIPAMRLVCRLYWYKRCWYKRGKLAVIAKGKQAISSSKMQEVLEELIKQGFVTLPEGKNNLSFDECTDLLERKQCRAICKSLLLKCWDSTKESAVRELSTYRRSKPITTYFTKGTSPSHVSNAERVLKLMQDEVGPCYKLSDSASETLSKLYLLMYLGMNYKIIREKKLELTLINDKSGTETYPIDRDMNLDNASVVFKTQIEFERYFEAHNIYENFLMQTDVNKKLVIIQNVYEKYNSLGEEEMKGYKALPVWLRRFTPAYLYIKIIEKGVNDFKKEENYQLAVDMLTTLLGQDTFRQHNKGEWYKEKALILHKHIRQYEMAGAVLLEGIQSNIPKILKQELLQRAKKLVKQKNIKVQENILEQLLSALGNEPPIEEKDFDADHVNKQPIESEGRGKQIFITRSNDELTEYTAEGYCISYYISNGLFTNGHHWEGSIVKTIFTLLFWDIIYMKLRECSGIFLTPYQVYPLDMFYPSFYENRKDIIEERLAWIEKSKTDELREEMRKVWDTRPESEISDIDRTLGWERVVVVCEYVGGRQLASVCRRLATDYAYARTGFPDLTLWNRNTKQIKFIEVKSDNDKPRINQLQWMHYLKSVGIDTGFCYVGGNTQRNKARSRPGERAETG